MPSILEKIMTVFPWGTVVWRESKTAHGYEGPGVIRGWAMTKDGGFRLLVGHVVEGGNSKEFLHVYTVKELWHYDLTEKKRFVPENRRKLELSDGHLF